MKMKHEPMEKMLHPCKKDKKAEPTEPKVRRDTMTWRAVSYTHLTLPTIYSV